MVSVSWSPLIIIICIAWLLHQISAVIQPTCNREIFGQPDFEACRALLFGTLDQNYEMLTRGINEIDRRDHLFHTAADTLLARDRPYGVSFYQWQQRMMLPQPRYPDLWVNSHPAGSVPAATRFWPVPWSNAGCNIMLLPVRRVNGQYTWDTGKYPALAMTGQRINRYCVRSAQQGGRDSGGLMFAGDNGRMTMVLYGALSRFDNTTRSRLSNGLPMYLNEPERPPERPRNPLEEPNAPPAPKRTKIDPDTSSVGSNNPVYSMALQNSLSANIGSGWWLHNFVIKPILPVVNAAKELVSFYNLVTQKAGDQLQAGTEESKRISFQHGAISLVLTGTDIIYWDWIIGFATAMVDSTNVGNPAQYKSTVTSIWQQNTILAELFLGGSGPG